MSSRLLFLGLLLIVFALVVRENMTKRPAVLSQTVSGRVEMCLSCHNDVKMDRAHDPKVLGCAACHLGDPLAIDKKKAHRDMVINPGDLGVVHRTCGVEGCHGPDVRKVKNSLMATNRGIIETMLSYWGEKKDGRPTDLTVEKLIKSGETSLALDYFRKLCATCHLWKKRGDLPGVFGEKGGGCTACHRVMPDETRKDRLASAGIGTYDPPLKKGRPHPWVTKKIPEENCIRCHNRSGRIGLSYIGVFEAEGYGTPFEKGDFSSQSMSDSRFYTRLSPDVHHEKKMACIDCHTRDEVMGDGTSYVHYEEQLEISCESCHSDRPGSTRKGKKLTNVTRREKPDGSFAWVMTGKVNDREYPLNPPDKKACGRDDHRRLSCDSCHSTWVPQCYGCHAKRDMRENHLDKLSMKETPGWWEEGRSYIRYERPMLAIWRNRVVPVTPGCQDIVTLVDKKGEIAGGFNRFTMAAISPHTTRKKGRTCEECHASTKTVGLGEGTAWQEDGTWHFSSTNKGLQTPFGDTPPFDAFVDLDGKPLQHSNRPDLRPFNKEEIRRILRVGQCLPCHKDYSDPVMARYDGAKKCPVFQR